MKKIKAIIKRPDEERGHLTNISNTLRNLQSIVGGCIETIYLGDDTLLIVNEEGWLQSLPVNFEILTANGRREPIVGTAILVGVDGEDFADVPITLQAWGDMLKEWER